MYDALNKITLAMFFSVRNFFYELKHELVTDERGLSGVVVAVLLIVVAVLAVIAIWGALNGVLDEWWNKIINYGGGTADPNSGTY